MLIEVLVSALILAIVASGVLALLQSMTHAAGDQRDSSKAYAVAQEDQARLRAMQLGVLNNLNQTTHPKLDGTTFNVESSAVFINNKASTTTCSGSGDEVKPDYVQLTSKVTWPGMGDRKPTVIRSIFSPVNGSVDPTTGALAISTLNAAGGPLSGVGLELTGAKTAVATSDANGCAVFVEMPEGNYTLKPSAPGLVDENGKPPSSKKVGVTVAMASPIELRYDLPGSFTTAFAYRVGSTSEFRESSQSSIMAFNQGMETAKAFSPAGGLPAPTIEATGLFPFTTPYAVYAGSCTSNNPNPGSDPKGAGAAAVTPITVPRGAASPPPIPTVQVPALNLTVKTGSTPIVGAKVRVTGTCSFERIYSTVEKTIEKGSEKIVEKGVLADPGLPWGTYEVCASAKVGSTNRRIRAKNVTVQNLTSGTLLNLDVSGSGSESNQTC
ncbi:MAG TPA: type II secretion system protein [Solirubrobacterales bacterium]|nr:type II secretion system protein [Solirubrobacterales bacterium]